MLPSGFKDTNFSFSPVVLVLPARFGVMKSYVQATGLFQEFGSITGLFASHVGDKSIWNPNVRGKLPKGVTGMGFGSERVYRNEPPIGEHLGTLVAP